MRRTNERGFTLISMVVAIPLLGIGVLGVVAMLPSLSRVSRASRETQLALSAVRSQLDTIRALPFPDPEASTPGYDLHEVFVEPGGISFTVDGLTLRASGAPHGTVTFLTEAAAAAFFGASVDFDADGVADEVDAPGRDFVAYPIRVEVAWRGGATDRDLEVTTIIYNNNK